MKAITWIFLIVAIVFIGIYTYDYFTMPRLDKIKLQNKCITQEDLKTFGLYKGQGYQIYIPKDWPFVKLSTAMSKSQTAFGINSKDPYEFFSIWADDYNKNVDQLLIDTLKSLSNYAIEKQDIAKTESNLELKHLLVSYRTEFGQMKQEMFAYTKNNKGFLILMRSKQENFTQNQKYLNKIICSFTLNN